MQQLIGGNSLYKEVIKLKDVYCDADRGIMLRDAC